MKLTVAYTVGRWNIFHKGHLNFMLRLLKKYDRLIIGIGSCYEYGSSRYPLFAFMREKMIARSLEMKGIDLFRVSFVHLQDFAEDQWDQWWKHITSIPDINYVTHFVSGNEEEILDEIKKRNIDVKFKVINPEKELNEEDKFPYHATDIRRELYKGNYDFFMRTAAPGTIELMAHVGGFSAMRLAMENKGQKFIPGRQAVDMIITCFDKEELMVLCGRRDKNKEDFPEYLAIPGGAIDSYENPLNTAIRELKEETGVEVKMVGRNFEPSHVIINNTVLEMKFVGLFGTENKSLSGTKGGSSQVFHIHLDSLIPENFKGKLRSKSDLKKVAFRPVKNVLKEGLAYQQNMMLEKAIASLK